MEGTTLIVVSALMTACGALANLLGELRKASNSAGGVVNPLRWIARRPYRVACTVLGNVVGFVFLWSTGQLTVLGCLAIGFAGDEVVRKLAERGDPLGGSA